MNASIPPNDDSVSLTIPPISPSYANALALSKLIFLPNIAPNSSSALIDDSKSNRLSATPLRVFILTPNLPAAIAASAMLVPPSLPNVANSSVEPAKSAITSAGTNPFCIASSLDD